MTAKMILFLLALSFFAGCATKPASDVEATRVPQSEVSHQTSLFLEKVKVGTLPFEQRMGYLPEAKNSDFKGCVIYLEGLGDSLMNHMPLYRKLSDAGYRVLMFDYLGQGGSEGTMDRSHFMSFDTNTTKVEENLSYQTRFVWKRYSEKSDSTYSRNCSQSPKRIIGSSIGGLVAFNLSHKKWAEQVVLISPLIIPNPCLGKYAYTTFSKCLPKNRHLDQTIDVSLLTKNVFAKNSDPHVEGIHPKALSEIPEFAEDLWHATFYAHFWNVPSKTKGLVFLPHRDDPFIDRFRTSMILRRHAPQFSIVNYNHAMSELDNEVPEVANDVLEKTLQFFNSQLSHE